MRVPLLLRVLQAVGQRIRELREERGLTQAQVAERLESQVGNYQNVEHGKRNVTMETLVNIATVLDVPIEELFVPPTSKRRGPGRPRSR